VSISEVGNKGNSAKLTKYLTFKYIKDKKKVIIKCEEVKLEVEIIDNYEEKTRLVEAMNYKYKYPVDQVIPMLRIYGFSVDLPQEFEESDDEYIIGSSSTIVEELLKEKDNSLSAIKTSEPSPNKHRFSLTDSNSSHEP
jgi:hypothetical protein